MKKSILVMAVAATMAASTAAVAEPKVYGNVHLSINAADNDVAGADNNLSMSSNTSSLGVKGSEDLGDGLKAIYKLEFGVNVLGKADTTPDSNDKDGNGNSGDGKLTGRDQFVGLKGGFGTVKLGTMSSNYKQMGGKVDPLYRTPLEGRGFLGTQSSALHGGRGVNRGRQTNTLQYVSPKMGGISLVLNTTLSGAGDGANNQNLASETTGVGVRWSNKAFLVYADWIDGAPTKQVPTSTSDSESSMKIGAKFSAKAFSIAGQFEAAEDSTSSDFIFLAGTFNINKNNMIALTAGTQTRYVASGGADDDSTGYALAYNHKMSKMTNVYVGYGARSEDAANADESMLSLGIRKKF
jgi:predicted porin